MHRCLQCLLESFYSCRIYSLERNLTLPCSRRDILVLRLALGDAVTGTDFHCDFPVHGGNFAELGIQCPAVTWLDADSAGGGVCKDQPAETAFFRGVAEDCQQDAWAVFLHVNGRGVDVQGSCFPEERCGIGDSFRGHVVQIAGKLQNLVKTVELLRVVIRVSLSAILHFKRPRGRKTWELPWRGNWEDA